eukprot:6352572-Lingulodinium_polyedra.AAC.1
MGRPRPLRNALQRCDGAGVGPAPTPRGSSKSRPPGNARAAAVALLPDVARFLVAPRGTMLLPGNGNVVLARCATARSHCE